MADCDVLILGGGNNGVGAAALLAKQGLKTIVLEKNEMLGGLASASHFWPGVTHNTGAWAMFHDQLQEMWNALDLDSYGCEMITPPAMATNVGETPDDKPYRMSSYKPEHDKLILEDYGPEVLAAEKALYEWFSPLSAGIDLVVKQPATSIFQLIDRLPSPEAKKRMSNLLFGNCVDHINRFHPDKSLHALRGQLAQLSIDGLWGGPMTFGSNLGFAQHVIGHASSTDVGVGYKIVKGTFGAMNTAVGQYVSDHGGTVKLNAEVDKIIIEKGKVKGVKLKNGDDITCDYLFSSLDPYNTFIRLMDKKDVPGWVSSGVKSINFRNHYMQAFLLLNGLPEYKGQLEYLNEGANGWWVTRFSSPETIEDNWDRVKMGRMIPHEDMQWNYMIPSLIDDSLAPKGQYSMTLYAPHCWPQGVPADKVAEVKETIYQNMITAMETFMPNMREIIVDHRVYASPDYEKKFNNTLGSFCHGEIQVDQYFDQRPIPGMAHWQVPFMPNMYLCGAGCHPGPGVSFLPGTGAVKRFFSDQKIQPKK